MNTEKSSSEDGKANEAMRCYRQPLFSRVWEMPNSNTFDIKCISRLIHKYHKPEMISIDSFCRKNQRDATRSGVDNVHNCCQQLNSGL